MEIFLNNLRGLFFFGTPHNGSILSDKARRFLSGPLMDELKISEIHSARLNHDFSQFLEHHQSTKLWGLAESQPTRLGNFEDVVVPEGSARFHKYDQFYTVAADHFGISKPESKQSSTYKFLASIVRNVIEEDAMDEIIDKTGANPMAMTCIALAMSKEGYEQRTEWKRFGRGLLKSLRSKAEIQLQGIGYGNNYWESIRFGFERLPTPQTKLLILMEICKGHPPQHV